MDAPLQLEATRGNLTIAVAKGRILKEALPLLRAAGVAPLDDLERSRKLIFSTPRPDVRILVMRATDVPTYVEYGAADLGIVGKDTLLEYDGDGFYEPLDLGIARCHLMVAAPVGRQLTNARLRIATKYAGITRRHFAVQGVQTEIIKLYGSMELAPLVGLADRIVDLVDTGNTLKANGLVELERICEVSARVIVNKAAWKTKHHAVTALLTELDRHKGSGRA